MQNLDLNHFGVQEMNSGEIRETDGGSWLSRRWDDICDAAEWVADNIWPDPGNKNSGLDSPIN